MATQKFTHLSSKSLIKALGTLTMNGSIGNAYVITELFDKAMLVLNDASLSGSLTVTVTGNAAAAGNGTHTVIKTVVFNQYTTDMSVEVDSEEVSYAEDQAGAEFLSVCFRLTGTNSDTVKAAVQVAPLHQRGDLTATGTGALT